MRAAGPGREGRLHICSGIRAAGCALAPPLCALAGCVPLSEQIAEDATPVATQQALETMAEPENAEEVAQLLNDPTVEAAVRELSEEVARGMFAAAAGSETDFGALGADMVRQLSVALGGGLRRDIAPALAGAVGQSAQAALEQALSEDNLRRARRFGAAVTEEAVQTLAAEIGNELIPEMVSGIVSSTAQAAADLDTARAEAAVGRLTYVAARQAVLGADDGLRVLQQRDTPSSLDPLTDPLEQALGWLPWIALMLGLLVLLGPLAWLVSAAGRRSDRRALAERDAAIRLLLETLQSAEDRPWSGELRELLRENLRDRHGADALRDALRRDGA